MQVGHAAREARSRALLAREEQGPAARTPAAQASARAGPQGPPGPAGSGTCPSGTTFFASVGCVEDAMRPAARYGNASTACGGIGRRMLTTAELDAYRQQPGVTIGEEPNLREWTG